MLGVCATEQTNRCRSIETLPRRTETHYRITETPTQNRQVFPRHVCPRLGAEAPSQGTSAPRLGDWVLLVRVSVTAASANAQLTARLGPQVGLAKGRSISRGEFGARVYNSELHLRSEARHLDDAHKGKQMRERT